MNTYNDAKKKRIKLRQARSRRVGEEPNHPYLTIITNDLWRVGEAPEADGFVATGGGEGGAVGRAGEGGDVAGVALEDGGACVGCLRGILGSLSCLMYC